MPRGNLQELILAESCSISHFNIHVQLQVYRTATQNVAQTPKVAEKFPNSICNGQALSSNKMSFDQQKLHVRFTI